MIAAGAGSVEAVQLLVKHGANIDAAEPRRGQTALMWAAPKGTAQSCEGAGRPRRQRQRRFEIGIYGAGLCVSKDDVESVRMLLAAGPRSQPCAAVGQPLLTMAMDAAALGRGAGAGRRRRRRATADRAGNRPLHVATQAGDVELVKKLLAKGADVNVRTPGPHGGEPRARGGRVFVAGGLQTPLMIAAQANQWT